MNTLDHLTNVSALVQDMKEIIKGFDKLTHYEQLNLAIQFERNLRHDKIEDRLIEIKTCLEGICENLPQN